VHVGAENRDAVGTHGRRQFGQGGGVTMLTAWSDSAPGACGEGNCPVEPG
jgi:hypothetical protein